MFKHVATALMIGALTVGAAACGSDAHGARRSPDSSAPGTDGDAPAGDPFAACPVGDPNCYEDGTGRTAPDDPLGGGFPVDGAIADAHGLLGRAEADLPPDVRIGRRGHEQMALTEDYVLGRMTVELDDTDGSDFRVVAVTVELPDGPQTFELTPG